jgi:hypothetical protein
MVEFLVGSSVQQFKIKRAEQPQEEDIVTKIKKELIDSEYGEPKSEWYHSSLSRK